MFSVDSSSIKYLEFTSSLNTTSNTSINLTNGGNISGSIVSASILYAPSVTSNTYTPSLNSVINNIHSIAIDELPTTASTVNTIYKQWYVPANTFKPGNLIQIVGTYRHSGSASITTRIYVNSGSSTVGTLLGTNVDTITAVTIQRIFAIRTNDTILIHGAAGTDLANNQAADTVNGCATITIPNLTGSTYWNIALQAAAASTQSFYATTLRILG
jgi:hypothetical protein